MSDSMLDSEGSGELQHVLRAWHGATVRLQQTHETLREEVARLTRELAVKNRELARKNRLADLGQIAAHVAHEVRNNLVPVSLYLSLLRRRLSDDSGSLDVLAKVESGMTALDAMVNDLLNFTSDREPRLRTLMLHDLVHDILDGLAPQLEAQGIAADVDIPRQLNVPGDADMLRRALLNLVLNSVDAMPDGGQLVFTAYCGPFHVELEVADSGPGLSDEARRRAFEPFFSTKQSGVGLGLAIVHRLVESHGGSISSMNCPDGGAAFTIRLPRRMAQEKAA